MDLIAAIYRVDPSPVVMVAGAIAFVAGALIALAVIWIWRRASRKGPPK